VRYSTGMGSGSCVRGVFNIMPLLFAADYPITKVQETIEQLRRVNDLVGGTPLPKVDPEAIETIIHRDALGLLALQ